MRFTLKVSLGGIVALIAIAAALTYTRYKQDLRAASARVSSGSRIVQTPCGPIEYAQAGSGPQALVVHGAGGGFDQGIDFGRPLLGFTVIAPSRFGYLGTPLPLDASAEAQAETHVCLLNALGITRVAAIGGSAGAPSVMQLCLRHPERCSAMVLVVPIAFAPGHSKHAPNPSPLARLMIQTTLRSDFVFWLLAKLARDTMIESILATPIADFERASPEEQARVRTILGNILPISRRSRGLANDAAIAESIPRYDLERITTPTLVVTVKDDLFGTFASSRYTAQHIRNARFIAFPNGGHLWVGHQPAVWSTVTGFLENSRPIPSADAKTSLTAGRERGR